MMRPREPLHALCLMLAALALWLSGCTVGPALLRVSRMQYNEAIQRTTDQQLLLNLVRLKYRDAPLFVEVGSISAQFQIDESAGLSGQLNESVGSASLNPDSLRFDARLGFIERPTITFTPLQGDEFVRRLLTPVSLDTVVLLIRSGWSIDRVLRLCVQRMNNLANAPRASGPTPDFAPDYREFAEATRMLRELQVKGILEIGYEPGRTELSAPMTLDPVHGSDLIAAAREGFAFRPTDNGGFVLTGSSRSLVMRIAPDALHTKRGRRLLSLLGLTPDVSTYDLVQGSMSGVQNGAEPADLSSITITPRSLIGALFYLSHAIEVLDPHRERGLVTATMDVAGEPFDWFSVTGDLLRIRCRKSPPGGAAVAVRYRGSWFYIDDADLNSKSTFSLLVQLFALQAGGAEGIVPVLTLPIG